MFFFCSLQQFIMITATKEVMYVFLFVCLSVCLFVSKIMPAQKVVDEFFWKFLGWVNLGSTKSLLHIL